MAAAIVSEDGSPAPLSWSLSEDHEGHRDYKIKFRVAVYVDDPDDRELNEGPQEAKTAPGLPQPGDIWNFDGEYDPWAFCLPTCEVKGQIDDEPCQFFTLEYTFTTKGMPRRQVAVAGDPFTAGQPYPVGNPLLEPAKISIDFVKYVQRATYDLGGRAITNSAFETIQGKENEWDFNRPQVTVEFNSAVPPIGGTGTNVQGLDSFIDHVNSVALWGVPPRCVKLSSMPKPERVYYHSNTPYWKVKLVFDIRYPEPPLPQDGSLGGGFDKFLLDEGHKALNGQWGSLPGSGATITIAVTGGAISGTPTVTSGGSGYPPSTTFNLSISGGTGGILQVTSDSSGAGGTTGKVVSVNQILSAGSGYTAGTKTTTMNTVGWLLVSPYTPGLPPDPSNPLHYCVYKDPKGQNTSVILNGHGIPLDAVTNLGGSPGSGCTIQISKTSTDIPGYPNSGTLVSTFDGVDTIFIVAGGSGYPSNTVINLSVAGGNANGVVSVLTDNSGIVSEFVGVPTGKGGSGYVAAVGAVATSQNAIAGQIFVAKYAAVNFGTVFAGTQFPMSLLV